VQIAGGQHHSIFLLDNGEVWGCGRCDADQVGIAEDHPAYQGVLERRAEKMRVKYETLEQAKRHLEAVSANPGAGEEQKQQAEELVAAAEAAKSAAMDEFIPEPVRIYFPPAPAKWEEPPSMPPFAEAQNLRHEFACISAGTRHNLAVDRAGWVYAWGFGQGGELGLGGTESAKVPTLVRSTPLRPFNAVSASAGGQHCVLLAQKREG